MLTIDNGPIHISKASRAALDARPWLTVEWLPKYVPELNDIERSGRDLKWHFLAHQTFRDIDQLERAIHAVIADLKCGAHQAYVYQPPNRCLESVLEFMMLLRGGGREA